MRRGLGGGDRFSRLDSDGNGTVSLTEFQAPQVQRFQRADADGDGVVTVAERQAAREATRGNRLERRQNRRGNR